MVDLGSRISYQITQKKYAQNVVEFRKLRSQRPPFMIVEIPIVLGVDCEQLLVTAFVRSPAHWI